MLIPLLIKAVCNDLTSAPCAPIFRPTDGFGAAAGAAAGAATAGAAAAAPSFAIVAALAMPVTSRPFHRWKCFTPV